MNFTMEGNEMDLNREVGEIKEAMKFLIRDVHEIKKDTKTLLGFKERMTGKMIAWSALSAFAGLVVVEAGKILFDLVSKAIVN